MIFQGCTFSLQRSSDFLIISACMFITPIGKSLFSQQPTLKEEKLCNYCEIMHPVCHQFLILFLLFELSVRQFVTVFPANQNIMQITAQSEKSTKFKQDMHHGCLNCSCICRI